MSEPTLDPSDWEEALIADLRAHGGRPSQGPLEGHPLLLMFSIGAKSGERRRAILTYSLDGEDYIVAGTAGGSPVTPAWVANVRANPRVSLEVANETFDTTATIVPDEDRDRLWDQHVAQLPWFADYETKISDRVIPVIRLGQRTAS
jgi:deazaflavin-dependent oxidoreductase (nitroreductase family)